MCLSMKYTVGEGEERTQARLGNYSGDRIHQRFTGFLFPIVDPSLVTRVMSCKSNGSLTLVDARFSMLRAVIRVVSSWFTTLLLCRICIIESACPYCAHCLSFYGLFYSGGRNLCSHNCISS